jgi:hypothetical protein
MARRHYQYKCPKAEGFTVGLIIKARAVTRKIMHHPKL